MIELKKAERFSEMHRIYRNEISGTNVYFRRFTKPNLLFSVKLEIMYYLTLSSCVLSAIELNQ